MLLNKKKNGKKYLHYLGDIVLRINLKGLFWLFFMK